MRAVSDNRVSCLHPPAVATVEACNAASGVEQTFDIKIRNETNAGTHCLRQEQIIERAAAADDRSRAVATGEENLVVLRGHQPQALDAVRLRLHLLPDAQLFQHFHALGRNAAAACFIAWEIVTV